MAKEKTTLERTNWWEEGMTSKMMLENLRRRAEMRWEHSAEVIKINAYAFAYWYA